MAGLVWNALSAIGAPEWGESAKALARETIKYWASSMEDPFIKEMTSDFSTC